jgi:hypothetical protein
MFEIFNPEIPGLEPIIPGFRDEEKCPGFEILGLESLFQLRSSCLRFCLAKVASAGRNRFVCLPQLVRFTDRSGDSLSSAKTTTVRSLSAIASTAFSGAVSNDYDSTATTLLLLAHNSYIFVNDSHY